MTATTPFESRTDARRIRRRVVAVVGTALAAALALVPVLGFLAFANDATGRRAQAAAEADAIVALTGGPLRVSDALSLLEQGAAKRLLISGVHPDVGWKEIARQAPHTARHVNCCVDLDHRALNTLGNAIETGRWMREHGYRSLLVVTSDYHMPRALMELGRVLPDVTLKPHPVVSEAGRANPWWTDPSAVKTLGGEYVKFVLAALRLRLDQPIAEPRRAARTTAG